MKLIRRNFVRSLLVGAGGMGLLGERGRIYALAQADDNAGQPAAGHFFFNADQVRTLEAIADQLIPPDDYRGGKDAGVTSFIDKALATWAPEHRWDYLAGLDGVNESSRLMFGHDFAALNAQDQTSVLTTMEKGVAPGEIWRRLRIAQPGSAVERYIDPAGATEGTNSSRAFFDLILRHAMEGYYAHPKYGGNRDSASWKMIGYLGMTHR
jgi:gluconate 2-dehydrogenase gamma chain